MLQAVFAACSEQVLQPQADHKENSHDVSCVESQIQISEPMMQDVPLGTDVAATSSDSPSTSSQDIPMLPLLSDSQTYCICSKPAAGEMIRCANARCEIGWFHLDCMKLKRKPLRHDKWCCSTCRLEPSNVAKFAVQCRLCPNKSWFSYRMAELFLHVWNHVYDEDRKNRKFYKCGFDDCEFLTAHTPVMNRHLVSKHSILGDYKTHILDRRSDFQADFVRIAHCCFAIDLALRICQYCRNSKINKFAYFFKISFLSIKIIKSFFEFVENFF